MRLTAFIVCGLALAQVAPARATECSGVFKRDSMGFQPSEGGMEPTGEVAKAGTRGRFTGFDIDERKRYYELAGQSLYPASDISLDKGCRLSPESYGAGH